MSQYLFTFYLDNREFSNNFTQKTGFSHTHEYNRNEESMIYRLLPNFFLRACSETTLTGESRFHIRTPLGIEPESLMTGSKRVDHWTRGTVYECSEFAGSPQGSPPAADYVGCEARRRTCIERETGTAELCEINWDYHIVGTTV
jgi:hypothetical protein